MKFDCGPTRQERAIARTLRLKEWHPYFAWRPIRVGPRDCRWLEVIERRGIFHSPHFDCPAPFLGYWEWQFRGRA